MQFKQVKLLFYIFFKSGLFYQQKFTGVCRTRVSYILRKLEQKMGENNMEVPTVRQTDGLTVPHEVQTELLGGDDSDDSNNKCKIIYITLLKAQTAVKTLLEQYSDIMNDSSFLEWFGDQ